MAHVEKRFSEFARLRKDAAGGPSVELEIRLQLSDPETLALLRDLSAGKATIERAGSISVLEPLAYDAHSGAITKSRRHHVHYPKKGSATKSTEVKNQIGKPITVSDSGRVWKLALSEETPVVASRPRQTSKILTRAMYRVSITNRKVLGGWRADISAVWEHRGCVNVGSDVLAGVHQKLIKTLHAASLEGLPDAIRAAQKALQIRLECELEWTGSGDPRADDALVVGRLYEMVAPGQKHACKGALMVVASKLYRSSDMAQSRVRGGLKAVLGSVKGLSYGMFAEELKGLPLTDWLATLKADGERCLVVCEGDSISVLTETGAYSVPSKDKHKLTIIEGELVRGRVYAYDIIAINGDLLTISRFADRVARIPEAVKTLLFASMDPKHRISADVKCSETSTGAAEPADTDDDDDVESADDDVESADDDESADDTESESESADDSESESEPADDDESADSESADDVESPSATAPWLSAKEYVTLRRGSELKLLEGLWEQRPLPFPVDGIILTAPQKTPSNYRDTLSYKWKPAKKGSIDFLVRRVPPSAQEGPLHPPRGAAGTMYALFVTVNSVTYHSRQLSHLAKISEILSDEQMEAVTRGSAQHKRRGFVSEGVSDLQAGFPVQFESPSYPDSYAWWVPEGSEEAARDYHDQICEMVPVFSRGRIDADNRPTWKFLQFRPDRKILRNYWGNAWPVAANVYDSVLNPLTLRHLGAGLGDADGYFAGVIDVTNPAKKALHSFVKRRLYDQLGTASVIKYHLELGVGRGADLRRITQLGPQVALMIDIDKPALIRLGARINSEYHAKERAALSRMGRANRSTAEGIARDTRFLLMQADLTADPDKNLKTARLIYSFPQANSISCQFVISYMFSDAASLKNFFTFAGALAASKAQFVLTFPDGQRVFDATRKGAFEVVEGGVVKYRFERRFKGSKMTPIGQRIAVKLPFRSELTEEYLVNADTLDKAARAAGFALMHRGYFDDRIPEFRVDNPARAKQLTPGDIKFAALHSYCVYKKK